MCDLDTQKDAEAFLAAGDSKKKSTTAFSRREFGLMDFFVQIKIIF